jgi:hypothetical protein
MDCVLQLLPQIQYESEIYDLCLQIVYDGLDSKNEHVTNALVANKWFLELLIAHVHWIAWPKSSEHLSMRILLLLLPAMKKEFIQANGPDQMLKPFVKARTESSSVTDLELPLLILGQVIDDLEDDGFLGLFERNPLFFQILLSVLCPSSGVDVLSAVGAWSIIERYSGFYNTVSRSAFEAHRVSNICAQVLMYSPSETIRRKAAGVLENTTLKGRSENIRDLIKYGGTFGEQRRIVDDLDKLFRRTFEVRSPCGNDKPLVKGFKPLLDVRMFDATKLAIREVPASAKEWEALFEYAYKGEYENEAEVTGNTVRLVQHFGMESGFSPHYQLQRDLLKMLQPCRNPQLFDFVLTVERDNWLYSGSEIPQLLIEMLNEWVIRPEDKIKRHRKRPHLSSSSSHERWCIQVHRDILMSRSVFFEKMLDAGFKESSSAFMDCSIETLACLVRYMYNGIDFDLDSLLLTESRLCVDLLLTAERYGMQGLQSYCEFYVAKYHLVPTEPPSSSSLCEAIEHIHTPMFDCFVDSDVYK